MTDKLLSPSATYYRCGSCDTYHAVEFGGDCREDNARLDDIDDLDVAHGAFGWKEVDQS